MNTQSAHAHPETDGSSEEIRRNIGQTRHKMDDTLDRLNDRLSPRAIINDVLDWFESKDTSEARGAAAAKGKRTARSVARTIRENPVPAALVGAGVAWAIIDSMTDDDLDEEEDWESASAYRRDPYLDYGARAGVSQSSYGTAGGTGGAGSSAGSSEEDQDSGDGGPSMGDKARGAKERAGSAISGAASKVAGKASDAGHAVGERVSATGTALRQKSRRAARRTNRRLSDTYEASEERFHHAMDEYPLAVGAGFLGLGLLAGLLLPRTRREDELMGDASDELGRAAAGKASDLADRAQEVAGRTAQAAADEAERQGMTPEHAREKVGETVEGLKSVAKAARDEASTAAKDEGVTPSQLGKEAESAGKKAEASASQTAEEKLRK